jgi:hypothetical protein
MKTLSTYVRPSATPPASDPSQIIRHGEKPADGGPGLTPEGKQRAQCLTDVFGASSKYNIGYALTPRRSTVPDHDHDIGRYVISEGRKPDGTGDRSYETVKPLANALGLPIDTSCPRNDQKCVAALVEEFAASSREGVLICWAHSRLGKIAGVLGVEDPPGASVLLMWRFVRLMGA